jgi:outer membrane protein TolC
MSIPLFDGWKTRNTKAKTIVDLDKNTLELQAFERSYNLQINQALTNIKTSIQSLEVQKNNMELAQEVSRVSRVKFENGLGSTLEIIDAETSYKEAETNYYNSLYDAIIAQIDLRKALGILIDN